ncbi:MAG: hypothetical protein V1494_00640 [Candidatus Diapherotrites archaeon]
MQKGAYHIVISRHAFVRAVQRRIHPDLIEDTVKTGKMKRFGKNNVKIEKRFKHYTITCVDEIVGLIIKIVTITKR